MVANYNNKTNNRNSPLVLARRELRDNHLFPEVQRNQEVQQAQGVRLCQDVLDKIIFKKIRC